MSVKPIMPWIWCGATLLLSSTAWASPLESYPSIQPLVMQALDAPDGRASGILDGPLSEKLRAQLRTTADLAVEVSTLQVFAQAGCKRLAMRWRLPGVMVRLPSGERTEFEMTTALNMCKDGQPPAEASGTGQPVALPRSARQP